MTFKLASINTYPSTNTYMDISNGHGKHIKEEGKNILRSGSAREYMI